MASFHFTRRLTHISVEPRSRFIFSCYTYATCGQLCVTTRVAPSLSNDSPACIYIYIRGHVNGLTHLSFLFDRFLPDTTMFLIQVNACSLIFRASLAIDQVEAHSIGNLLVVFYPLMMDGDVSRT